MDYTIEDQLARTLGRRDEGPNIALAKKIAEREDAAAIDELIRLIETKHRDVQYDALKVLYETGVRNPDLIHPHFAFFLKLLTHRNNRIQWSAMTALSVISTSRPQLLSKHLVEVVDAMDKGSVITRDHGIYILANVGRLKEHHANCMELLLEQVEKSPVNQVPMYAEKTAAIISPPYIPRLKQILASRKDVLSIPSKQKRIQTLVNRLED